MQWDALWMCHTIEQTRKACKEMHCKGGILQQQIDVKLVVFFVQLATRLQPKNALCRTHVNISTLNMSVW